MFCIYGPNETDLEFYEELKDFIKRECHDWNVVPSGLPLVANPDLMDCQTVPNELNAAAL